MPQILAKRLANPWHCFMHLRTQTAHTLSNLKENVRVGTFLQNVPYFNLFRNLQKSQMPQTVYTQLFVRLLQITSANCTEV